MKKQIIRKLLAFSLCMACFPTPLQIHAQEEHPKYPYVTNQYVAIKKVNSSFVLLKIGKGSTHSFRSGMYVLLGDTYLASANWLPNAEYGDIFEYQGGMTWQEGTRYNRMFIEEPEGTFEKIGTVFDNPTADAGSRTIDGKPFLAVRMADGATYLIGQGSDDEIDVDITLCPNQQGDVNDSNDVDIMDVITMNKYILGLRELSESAVPAADLNHDGNLDAADSLAILKLVLDMTD